MPIEIYNDNVFEDIEEFTICLPDLNATNTDVTLINATEPTCVSIRIIDNDAVVGLTMSSTLIREGASPQTLCVGVLMGRLFEELHLNLIILASHEHAYG